MTPGAEASGAGTWAPLLLADPSPNLRLLVLRDLLGRPEGDTEVQELAALQESDAIVQRLLSLQDADGSWPPWEGGGGGQRIRSTAQALVRLGYLGFRPEHPAIRQGAEYLFRLQQEDGSWPLPQGKGDEDRELREGYSMIPLQTGIPLRALAMAGYSADPRAERAYEWLLAQGLSDGGWPTGTRGGKQVFAGGYRRLAHSRLGCRTNSTFAVSALAYHPERRKSPNAQRGLDLLLAQDSLPAHTLGFEVARTIGVERAQGFFTYFARYDVGLILDLCWRVGASSEDERVAGMVDFVKGLQGRYGLWEYAAHPEASRWVSFDLLRSLSRIDLEAGWLSLEPRTPFQPYPKARRRY
jgi:hypothetical protein